METLKITVLTDRFAVCSMDSNYPIPLWVLKSRDFYSITRTEEELSIVCFEASVPPDIRAEKGWKALKIEGSLDFNTSGILNSLLEPLAEADISVFVVSTFTTDYVLVKEEALPEAKKVLSEEFETAF